jgi:hypothetical protein
MYVEKSLLLSDVVAGVANFGLKLLTVTNLEVGFLEPVSILENVG